MLSNLIQFNGVQASVIPIECLTELKTDIVRFREAYKLNDYQKSIINDKYILDIPELTFAPKSIIVAAVKFEILQAIFAFGNKIVTDIFCITPKETKEHISKQLEQKGYNYKYVHWLPQKRLAVCSGLAEYGRNNIAYTDEFGSLMELQTLITDMPYDPGYIWREVKCMDICEKCGECVKSCPTGSIISDRFLIDNEICLCRFIEGIAEFPEYIDKSCVGSVSGCYKCQDICPKDRELFSNISETVRFDTEETKILLSGVIPGNINGAFREKIERLGIKGWCLKNMPHNLKLLFDNA